MTDGMTDAYQQRLQALLEVSNELVLMQSADALCRRAVELGHERLGFDRLSIWLCSPANPSPDAALLEFRGTFGIDEFGRLRDERSCYTSIDVSAQTMRQGRAPASYERETGDLWDDRRSAVGSGVRLWAVIRDGDRIAGLLSVDNLLSGRDLTSRDGDLLALFSTALSNLLFRRRAELATREREHFYRTVFETTGTAMLVVNGDDTIALANGEAERLLGVPCEALVRGKRVSDFVMPVDQVDAHDAARRRLDGSGPVTSSYEALLSGADGNVLNAAVTVGLVPGGLQRIVSIQDITAHKQAMEKARKYALVQAALSAVAAEATATDDLDSLLYFVVRQVAQALGVASALCSISGHTAWLGIPEGDLDAATAMSLLRDARQDPLVVRDFRDLSDPRIARAGNHFLDAGICAVIGTPIVGLQEAIVPSGLIVASEEPRDWSENECEFVATIGRQLISAVERHQLMARVKQQVQHVQAVMETVPEGVILLSDAWEVLLVNSIGEDYLAAFSDAKVGERLNRLGLVSLEEVLVPLLDSREVEVSNGERWVLMDVHPVADSQQLGGWVLVVWDGTESQRIERQIHQQARLAAVGQLAAGIAHDFNNIMAVIILYAQMTAAQRGLPAVARERLNVIHDQARSATSLIDQILDFGRRAYLERCPVDLRQLLEELVTLWQRTLPESIRFELVHDPVATWVDADRRRLQQALMNLATNARDALPGGGDIRIELASVSLDASTVPISEMMPGNWVRLRFSDTGTGIAPELLQRVFEPFFTTKEPGKGTGLGLAQIYGIVKQHDGEVTIDSIVGQGTTVTIYLPALSPASADECVPAEEDAPLTGDGETVLVVEDNPAMRQVVVEALDDLGYRVAEASTGVEALALLGAQGDEIALVVSDAIMPEMGGVELLNAMAEGGYAQPVVILSGYAAPDQQAELQSMPNFVTWLTKPVDLALLADVVRQSVEAAPGS